MTRGKKGEDIRRKEEKDSQIMGVGEWVDDGVTQRGRNGDRAKRE